MLIKTNATHFATIYCAIYNDTDDPFYWEPRPVIIPDSEVTVEDTLAQMARELGGGGLKSYRFPQSLDSILSSLKLLCLSRFQFVPKMRQ